MNDKPKLPRNKRPLSITLICSIYFLLLFIALCALCLALCLPSIRQHITSQEISLSFVSFWWIATCITMFGLWKMKKWAAYSYTGIATLTQIELWLAGEFSPISLFKQGLYLYFILKHLSKMS